MAMLNPRNHVVRSGESMAKIAAQYGYRDWKAVYSAPCNAPLRQKRPDPNAIRPGDVVLIPPRPDEVAQVLRQRLTSLEKLRRESNDIFAGLVKEIEDEHAKVARTGQTVDAVAEVSQILIDLGSLVHKGYNTLSMTGEALEKANRELAATALKDAYTPVAEKSLEAWAAGERPSEGLVWALGKTLVKSWSDMKSPSFWASVVSNKMDGQSWSTSVTRRPEDWLNETRAKIAAQRAQTLKALDEKIALTQKQLLDLG